jgi:hypothetical protein
MGNACCTSSSQGAEVDGERERNPIVRNRAALEAPHAVYIPVARVPRNLLLFNRVAGGLQQRGRPLSEEESLEHQVWRSDALAALMADTRRDSTGLPAQSVLSSQYITAMLERSLQSRQQRVASWQRLSWPSRK